MKAVVMLALMTACSAEPEDDAMIVGLSADTYYELGMWPCDAPSPDDCTYELGLCVSNAYAIKLGDVITESTYVLDDGIVVDSAKNFEFDLATQMTGTNGEFDGQAWTVVPIAPDVVCTQ